MGFFSAQPPTFPDFAPWLTYRPPLPLQGYLPLQNNLLASKFVSGLYLKNFFIRYYSSNLTVLNNSRHLKFCLANEAHKARIFSDYFMTNFKTYLTLIFVNNTFQKPFLPFRYLWFIHCFLIRWNRKPVGNDSANRSPVPEPDSSETEKTANFFFSTSNLRTRKEVSQTKVFGFNGESSFRQES